ncbi:MAG: glycosyltransferase family 2 protein [Alphaproteobacteria bacterium]
MESVSDEPALSVVVTIHDEETQLEACLSRLDFADELVLVLDRCTDGSKEIALRFTERLVEGAWELEGPRRNAGIDAATGDWIFEVDADERVPEALGREIRETIAQAAPGYFLVPFENYVGGRLVRYGWGGSWGVMAAPRLFSRGAKRWGEQRVHPALALEGRKRWLKTAVVHHVDANVSDMLERLDRYTELRAADLRDGRARMSPFPWTLRRSLSRFLKCYLSRKGYREGRMGFAIALMAALYPLISHLKAELDPPADD